jgi:hypothetical protein
MRGAFGPFMPPRIVARFSKNATTPFYMRNTRDTLLRWIDEPDKLRILKLDFLDRDRVIPYLEILRDAGRKPELFMVLLRIEQWLESRQARAPNKPQHGWRRDSYTESYRLSRRAYSLRG